MNLVFQEQHGAGWISRLLAILFIILGGVAAWGWLKLQIPVYTASMQILTPAGERDFIAAEQLLAATLNEPAFGAQLRQAAEKADAAERNQSPLYRYLQIKQTPAPETAEKLWRANLRRQPLNDRRGWELTLTYPTFGEPAHSGLLSQIGERMSALWEERALAEQQEKIAKRDAEAQKITAALTAVKPDPAHHARAAATLTLLTEALAQGAAPVAAWQSAWNNYPALQPYLDDIARAWNVWQQSRVALKQYEHRLNELTAWIELPQNQTVKQTVKRMVYHEDTPALLALRDRKAQIEAARMRLLERATPLHPQVKAMSLAIDELNAQINALTRLPQLVEDVEERTNPQLLTWRRDLTDVRAALKDATIQEQAAKTAVGAAIESLRIAEQSLVELLTEKERAALRQRYEEIVQTKILPAAAPLARYSSPAAPTRVPNPDAWLVYAIGIGAGCLLALVLLSRRREIHFDYTEPPAPAPEYPVLGVIPDFREPPR